MQTRAALPWGNSDPGIEWGAGKRSMYADNGAWSPS